MFNLRDERVQERNTPKIEQSKRKPQTMIAPRSDRKRLNSQEHQQSSNTRISNRTSGSCSSKDAVNR